MNDRNTKKRGVRSAERGMTKSAARLDRTDATQATDAVPATTDPAAEPFIGKAEVARRLGRTLRAVNKLMKRGRIPYYKFDWRVAFRWSEVQTHLAETCRVCRSREVAR